MFCSWEEPSDPLEPLCVLNVSEVKQEEDDEYSAFSFCDSKKRKSPHAAAGDTLDKVEYTFLKEEEEDDDEEEEEEADLFFEVPSWELLSDRHSGIEVGESSDDFLARGGEKSFDKLVLISKRLGTKTTVLPQQEGSHVTRIDIDDLSVKPKEEPSITLEEEGASESSSLGGTMQLCDDDEAGSAQPGDGPCEASGVEFEVVYSFNEGEFRPSGSGEGDAVDAPEGGESQILSLLHHQIERTRGQEESALKVLKKQQDERKEVFSDLLIHINELVDP